MTSEAMRWVGARDAVEVPNLEATMTMSTEGRQHCQQALSDRLEDWKRFVLVSNLASAHCVPASVTQIWKRRRP